MFRFMNLLLAALRQAMDDAARERGVESYRVVWKHNGNGDFFIGITTSDPRFAAAKIEPRRAKEFKPR